jgi:hypothetical protein
MPKQLTAGQDGTINVTLVDDNDTAVQATAVSWSLNDAQGNPLGSGTVDGFVAGASSATVALTAALLTLTAPVVGAPVPASDAREIVLACTTAPGVVEVREAFLIVSSAPLQCAVNSFQTFPEAVLLRTEFANLAGWDEATKQMQIAAMQEAYRRLLRVSVELHAYPDTYKRIAWWGRRVPLSRINEDEFRALPHSFQHAMKRAQLAEANVLLGGDPAGDKREMGIISESIGEAKMFFQSRPYLNLPISRQAYEEIKSFIRIVVQVARA